MTWSQYTRARHLLAEEVFGAAQRPIVEAQDAEFDRSLTLLRTEQGA